MLAYADTRGLDDSRPAFTDVILKGIAPGGGLYVPERIPILPDGWVETWRALSYPARALAVLELFEVDLDVATLARATVDAYSPARFDHPRVAPVKQVADGRHVLELWHGPTCAFKDMALQLKPILFAEAVRAKRAAGVDTGEFLILVATSGDTGKAALEGYRDREFVRIAVLYPKDGVSELQELMMVTQEGANVAVFGIKGDFDDAQAAVKAAFTDEAFAARLAERGLSLSSANSINFGRVLPQIVYYASTYADLVAARAVQAGEPVDFCVPTGNFGNILAGYYARAMGVPIARLICASNENNVLADFLATGVYDLTARHLVQTPSPSMDILVSSNLERLLYAAAGMDGAASFDPARAATAVRGWMDELREKRRFEVDPASKAHISEVFAGGWVTNEDTLATIGEVYREHGYLMDPHTAVAWRVADRLAEDRPVVIVSTAHWAKFGPDVHSALAGPDAVTEGRGAVELMRAVLELAPGQRIPAPLADIDGRPVRFTEVIDCDPASVEAAVEGALAHM
jgi:threonine synthase